MYRDSVEDLFLLGVLDDLDDVFGTGMRIIDDLDDVTLVLFIFDFDFPLQPLQLYEEKEEYDDYEIIEFCMLPDLILDKMR